MAKKKSSISDIEVGHTYNPPKVLPDPPKDKIGDDNVPRWVQKKRIEHRKSLGYEKVESQDGVTTEVRDMILMRTSKKQKEARDKWKAERIQRMEDRARMARKGLKGKQVVTRDGKTILRTEE